MSWRMYFQKKNNTLVQKWKDKRDVLTISTKHNTDLIEIPSSRIKGIKARTVFDCNKNMSGVDRCDQMTAYYSTPRKENTPVFESFLSLI